MISIQSIIYNLPLIISIIITLIVLAKQFLSNDNIPTFRMVYTISILTLYYISIVAYSYNPTKGTRIGDALLFSMTALYSFIYSMCVINYEDIYTSYRIAVGLCIIPLSLNMVSWIIN